jgi:hypothetical protein
MFPCIVQQLFLIRYNSWSLIETENNKDRLRTIYKHNVPQSMFSRSRSRAVEGMLEYMCTKFDADRTNSLRANLVAHFVTHMVHHFVVRVKTETEA